MNQWAGRFTPDSSPTARLATDCAFEQELNAAALRGACRAPAASCVLDTSIAMPCSARPAQLRCAASSASSARSSRTCHARAAATQSATGAASRRRACLPLLLLPVVFLGGRARAAVDQACERECVKQCNVLAPGSPQYWCVAAAAGAYVATSSLFSP